MDILGLYLPGWLVCILTLPLLLYLYTTYKQSYFKRRGIPGPKPRPFVGVLPDVAKLGFMDMDIKMVREHGKFYGTYMGNSASWIVADPKMLKEILVKEFPKFVDHSKSIVVPKFWQNAVNNACGNHWRFLRATLSPTFSTGKMRNMTPILHKCMDDFIDCVDKTLEQSSVCDVQALFGALTMDVICSTSFGIEVNSQKNPDDLFVKNAKKAFSFVLTQIPIVLLSFLFPELRVVFGKLNFNYGDQEVVGFFRDTTKAAIADRLKQPDTQFNDLLQVMINAHKQEVATEADEAEDANSFKAWKRRGLTDDETVTNSIMFLLAGYDTTAATLTWLTYCLALNQDCQQRLKEEIDQDIGNERPTYDNVFKLQYLDMVLSETLRMYTPAVRTNRTAEQDVNICGIKIPKGANIQVPIHGIHRCPEFWPEPDRFDPERFAPENKEKIVPFSYLPFGVGPRNCIGMRLALLEVKMAAVVLLQRYKLQPCAETQIPPKISKSVVVKPEGMFLRLDRR